MRDPDKWIEDRFNAQDKRIEKVEGKVEWLQRIVTLAIGAWTGLVFLVTLGFNILTGRGGAPPK